MGSSENIADAVSFCSLPNRTTLLGQTLSVNGGMWI